jgi:hypothetical protein
MNLHQKSVLCEGRVSVMGGGGFGLLALRVTATGGVCGRVVKRPTMSVARRVTAVPADHQRAHELAAAGARTARACSTAATWQMHR